MCFAKQGCCLVMFKLEFKVAIVKCLFYNDIPRFGLKSEMLYKHMKARYLLKRAGLAQLMAEH